MSTEDELRNCRQGKRILKKRVDELERELRDARGRLSMIGNTLAARDPAPATASDHKTEVSWMYGVVAAWRRQWRGKDHRYGRDFAAFVGERVLTDFHFREFEELAHEAEKEES